MMVDTRMAPTDLTTALRSKRNTPDRERMATALSLLHAKGYLSVQFIQSATNAENIPPALFTLLVAIGRGDLSVARLYEGHVNALQLVARLATPAQFSPIAKSVDLGGLLGVWGADDPLAPGRLQRSGGRWRLCGSKVFASGADLVGHAVVAVKSDERITQLVLLDREAIVGRLDAAWWNPIGMQATNSFKFNLDGIEIGDANFLGPMGAYETQPFFGAGAIRFVAAQLGGTLALWDATREHLLASNRYENPHQAARLGQIVSELEAVYSLVRSAYASVAPAISWDDRKEEGDNEQVLADCARVAVEFAAERVMNLAVKSVGCAGLMEAHPLAAAARDLLVYLRQPAPDAALTRIGVAACDGRYRALFDER